jgi:predicted metal-dependent phosphoesterase TrpH
LIDLHVHSTASDGALTPEAVVNAAAEAGLAVIALTDHDTLAGVPDALKAGEAAGVRVIAGCEFSVRARWGEMHLLGYFLAGSDPVARFLEEQRAMRRVRAQRMVERLDRLGVAVTFDEVLAEADGGAVGRPHVARALVGRGAVTDVPEAFQRYIGWRRPAFVAKELPEVEQVTELVRRAGGVTSAAHLGGRGSRSALKFLRSQGVDAIEVQHPIHDDERAAELDQWAEELGLLRTGGTDFHGDATSEPNRAPLGSIRVPETWLEAIEHLHVARRSTEVTE